MWLLSGGTIHDSPQSSSDERYVSSHLLFEFLLLIYHILLPSSYKKLSVLAKRYELYSHLVMQLMSWPQFVLLKSVFIVIRGMSRTLGDGVLFVGHLYTFHEIMKNFGVYD